MKKAVEIEPDIRRALHLGLIYERGQQAEGRHRVVLPIDREGQPERDRRSTSA